MCIRHPTLAHIVTYAGYDKSGVTTKRDVVPIVGLFWSLSHGISDDPAGMLPLHPLITMSQLHHKITKWYYNCHGEAIYTVTHRHTAVIYAL